ncbi:hypothetical protein [Streptomyces sp900116325]|uniref:hypothetical protein n=1 Tax=Streptomyces sp. 900116325 TaxID=3154295 RepID=UPI0033BE8A7C
MTAEPVHFCWNCYAHTDRAAGVCTACGLRVEPPVGTMYPERRLVCALHHPLLESRPTAAQILGQRREFKAAPALQALALASNDPYLAATVLGALLPIRGFDAVRPVLEESRGRG